MDPGEVPQPLQAHAGFDGSQPMELEGKNEAVEGKGGDKATTLSGIGGGGGNLGGREKRDIDVDEVGGPIKKPKLNDDVKAVNKGKKFVDWSRVLCGTCTEQEPEFSLFDFRIRHDLYSNGIEVENIMKKTEGFYIFIFKNGEGMLKALAQETWTFSGVKVVVKKWGPGHFPEMPKEAERCRVWIEVYNMPLELWKLEVVGIMSTIFGKFRGIDDNTKRMCKDISFGAKCAKFVVEVGTTTDVVDGISVSYPIGGGFQMSYLRIECEYRCSFCKVNSHLDSFCNAIDDDIEETEEMIEQKWREYVEQEKAMMLEQHDKAHDTCIKVAIARDQDLLKQIGEDIYFDLVDHEKVGIFHVDSQKSFNSVKEEVAKEFGVPVEFQRFWTWAMRENQTYRPYRHLTCLEETKSVRQLRATYNNTNKPERELNLFLETERGPDLLLRPPTRIREEDILVFFKLYDPDKSKLRYVCRLFVSSSVNPTEIIPVLKEKVGFNSDEEIELYEEVKSERYHEQEFDPCVTCQILDKTTSFRSSQIKNGDIICFQKLSNAVNKYTYPDLPSFLEYAKNRQLVNFRSKDKPKEEAFSLHLSKLDTYNVVADSVAQQLGVDDPSKIRFTPHHSKLNPPDANSYIKYQAKGHLLDMLGDYNEGSDILYYEVFDIPIPELEGLITLKVAFSTTIKDEPVIHNIRLPEDSTVGDVLTAINKKVNADAELRLLQINCHRICKVFTPTEKINDIDEEFGTLRAEKIPEEEKVMGPRVRCIHVCHCNKEAEQNPPQKQQVKNFGEPFFMVIREHETLNDVKVRIQRKLEVPSDEFSKWRFAIVYRTSPEYLQDLDVVTSRFQRTMYAGSDPPYLGLEHLEQPGPRK